MIIECANSQDALARAREAIEAGELIVLPTDTVYGLGADPTRKESVDRLLTAKGRGRDKPSPVLVASVEQAEALATDVSAEARILMAAFWPGALTIVLPARQLGWDLGETNGTVAVRMPNDPFTLKLLHDVGPLAVSSANLTARDPANTAAQAREQLGAKVAVYLDRGECGGGTPSTIVGWPEGRLAVFREGAISRADIERVVKESV